MPQPDGGKLVEAEVVDEDIRDLDEIGDQLVPERVLEEDQVDDFRNFYESLTRLLAQTT